MSKTILHGKEAKDKVIKGIDKVADIVKTTVGPKGRNILIREQISRPFITNDGITIAKSIQLKDNIEDAGAQLIIQAANKTNEVAGDGTTSTTILAQKMIHNFYLQMEDTKQTQINPIQVQKEMIKASEDISKYLLSIAEKVKDNESIKRVASISSGSDDTGDLIAKAFELAGEYGSVIVEESKTGEDNLTSIQGMKLSNGIVNQYLLNDPIKGKSDMVDVKVLITLDKIDNIAHLFQILDYTVNTGAKLLIICDDIELEPLNMVLMNKAQGRLSNIGIIRLPGFRDLREDLINDISIATGATIMGRENGILLKDFTPEYLGEALNVILTLDDTIIKFKDLDSRNNSLIDERKLRVKQLQAQLENSSKEESKHNFS